MIKKHIHKVWWIPTALLIVLNMTLLLIIEILKNIGRAIVWCNNHVSEAGEIAHSKATDKSNKIDELIERIREAKERKKEMKQS